MMWHVISQSVGDYPRRARLAHATQLFTPRVNSLVWPVTF